MGNTSACSYVLLLLLHVSTLQLSFGIFLDTRGAHGTCMRGERRASDRVFRDIGAELPVPLLQLPPGQQLPT